MQEATRQMLLEKNQKLINMVIERAKRDFPEDIALIGLTGSFRTGDFHEKSDLDLIIVNLTDRGWGIAAGFILEDVGYDIYCTPWKPRLEAQAKLESPMVSILLDLEVLYCAKPEYREQLEAYRRQALALLAEPIGEKCLARAKRSIDAAKLHYADTLLAEKPGRTKYFAGAVLYETVNALVSLNNTYIKRGIKRYLEELRTYAYLPENFEALYMAVIDAGSAESARAAAGALLRSLVALYDGMREKFAEKPVPTHENMWGTYEELWCNCRNKVLASVAAGDRAYAFHAALGAQNYLDEMTAMFGTKQFDLMEAFDASNLPRFRDAFLRAMNEYADIYRQVGRRIERFDSIEALRDAYMQSRLTR